MTKEDKTIKELKKVNHKLKHQYDLLQIRNSGLQSKIETLKEMKLHTEKYASEMEDKYILEKSKNDKAIEYCKELMLFKKNSRQYLIGKCMFEKLGGVDKE